MDGEPTNESSLFVSCPLSCLLPRGLNPPIHPPSTAALSGPLGMSWKSCGGEEERGENNSLRWIASLQSVPPRLMCVDRTKRLTQGCPVIDKVKSSHGCYESFIGILLQDTYLSMAKWNAITEHPDWDRPVTRSQRTKHPIPPTMHTHGIIHNLTLTTYHLLRENDLPPCKISALKLKFADGQK
ncbi:hypothetical protein LY76DRAFT_325894 [Colletotrichum caudatum]|nr:hypothetical protein LY76DRAFT_325894 [Colletotrichum caudatum]